MPHLNLKPTRPGRSTRAGEIQARFNRAFIHLATGGDWANTQTPATRRNLLWFWFDGLFASASDNIINTYLVIYLLALGATQGQIGLLSSLSALSAALMLMPGALLVERFGRRRKIVLGCAAVARGMLLLLALAPLLHAGPVAVILAISMTVLRDASANLSFPAWMSMTADVVPLEGRGRYFASRNFIMGLMGMATTFLVGLLISSTLEPAGYQIALGLAFLFGSGSIFSFGHLSDAPQAGASPAHPLLQAAANLAEEEQSSEEATAPAAKNGRPAPARRILALRTRFRTAASEMRAHAEFTTFAGIGALWNFSLNIAGPFFNVYLVQNLHADAAMVGLTSIASSMAGMLVQRKTGELNDRWGARRLMVLSGLLIPVVPLAWAFIDSPLYVIPINLVSGALWAGYNLGSFNHLLSVTPADRMARYSAIYQIVITTSLALGAALGSVFVSQWGIPVVFVLSAAGRLVTAVLFARITRRKKAVDNSILAETVPLIVEVGNHPGNGAGSDDVHDRHDHADIVGDRGDPERQGEGKQQDGEGYSEKDLHGVREIAAEQPQQYAGGDAWNERGEDDIERR